MAAGDVDVELVPGPGLFVAFAVFLTADVAGGRQVGEHLAEVLRDLPFETRRLWLRTLFVLAWTSALARRRGIIGRRGIVFAVVGLHLDWLLARLDLGGVAGDHADDAPSERALDQRRVHLVRQIALRELREGARERGFRRHLRASLPTENVTQRRRDARSGRWWSECPAPPSRRRPSRGRADPRAGGRGRVAVPERRPRGRSHRGS